MSWLVGQLWPFLVLAAVIGAALTTWAMTARVHEERPLDERPVEPAFPVLGTTPLAAAVPDEAPTPGPVSSSPFPSLPDHSPDDRPWEAEELWSRPARLAAGSTPRRSSKDEWAEAAASWRSWADEAAGRAFVDSDAPVDDDDLFAADREAERRLGHATPDPEAFLGDDADVTDEDDFPYARPVEAG